MKHQKNIPPRAISYILFDLLALILVFAVLALTTYAPLQQTVRSTFIKSSQTASQLVNPAEPLNSTPQPVPTASPTPEPTPTPVPGDFSDAFSRANIPEGMDYVYRGQDYLIGIEEYYVDNAVLFVADVYVRDVHLLKTAFANGSFKGRSSRYENIVSLCEDNNALFGVSGDYVSIREDGVVIRNGELLQNSKYTDILVLYVDGTMAVYGPREKTIQDLTDGSVWQTWCFGPNLLDKNGQAIEINHKLMRNNPRCAIGYYEPGHYAFVVVDGRTKYYSEGMTLTALSTFMADIGCKVAYNLDGGQTAQMVLEDNLVNMPANGGRRVGDIIYIEVEEPKQ